MPLIRITSALEPFLSDYSALTDSGLRRSKESAHGLYIAESSKVVRRALEAGHQPRSFLMAEKWVPGLVDVFAAHPEVPVYVGPDKVLEQLTGFHLHRGALAAMNRPELASVSDFLASLTTKRADPAVPEARRIAVFEDIVDHTNLGAAFRSAAAFGVDGVLVSPRCADPLYRRSVRVSMGTVFQVPWTRSSDFADALRQLREAGFVVAGMSLDVDSVSLKELASEQPPRLALVFGTEGDGITAETAGSLDVKVTIPMRNGVDSLNVAASCAVAFYAVT